MRLSASRRGQPQIGGTARLSLLRSIAELLLGRQLYPREGAALERAYVEVEQATRRRRRQPRIPEIVSQLLRPSPDGAAALETDVEELQEWGRDVGFSLRRLVTGNLAGMFDEETSPGLDLDGPMASVNLRQVSDAAKPILMACLSAWLRGVWGRGDGRRRIVVQEGAWHRLKPAAFAEMQQENFKLARQYGVQNIIVTHHLGDLKAPRPWLLQQALNRDAGDAWSWSPSCLPGSRPNACRGPCPASPACARWRGTPARPTAQRSSSLTAASATCSSASTS